MGTVNPTCLELLTGSMSDSELLPQITIRPNEIEELWSSPPASIPVARGKGELVKCELHGKGDRDEMVVPLSDSPDKLMAKISPGIYLKTKNHNWGFDF